MDRQNTVAVVKFCSDLCTPCIVARSATLTVVRFGQGEAAEYKQAGHDMTVLARSYIIFQCSVSQARARARAQAQARTWPEVYVEYEIIHARRILHSYYLCRAFLEPVWLASWLCVA